jgi:hypothetical protein
MTLYEMTQAAQSLYELFGNDEIDERVVNDTLEGLEVELKLEDYCKVIRQFKSDAEQFKSEMDRIKKKITTCENSIKRLNSSVLAYMTATGKTSEKAGIFTIKVSTSKAVNIIDEKLLPKEFFVEQPSKVDKESIRKLLMANETVDGAELQINRNIQIK